MNAFFSGIGGSALLFVLSAASGLLLSHWGRPYPTLIFNIHKLIAVGAVVIIVRNIYHMQQVEPLRAFVGPGALLITGLLFAALIVSGSVLSMQNGGVLNLQASLLETMHTVHKMAPVSALIAAGLSFGLLAGARVA